MKKNIGDKISTVSLFGYEFTVKQRPILMSPPMVEALQREINPKTVTRRTKGLEYINQNPDKWKVIRPLMEYEPLAGGGTEYCPGWERGYWIALKNPAGLEDGGYVILSCPYGQPGDQMWVKETYYAWGYWENLHLSNPEDKNKWFFVDHTGVEGFEYLYGNNAPEVIQPYRSMVEGWHKRSSLFMPRAASRFTEEITGIRCERLQEITEADAIAEGVIFIQDGGNYGPIWEYQGYVDYMCEQGVNLFPTARESYQTLWESINGPGSWDKNEWVWPVTFKQL